MCVSLWAWWEVVAVHHWVMTMHALTCRLTAEYGNSSIPQHSTYEYGTHLYLYLLPLTRITVMAHRKWRFVVHWALPWCFGQLLSAFDAGLPVCDDLYSLNFT